MRYSARREYVEIDTDMTGIKICMTINTLPVLCVFTIQIKKNFCNI